MDAAELIWNLKRLIRDGFPQGLPVSDLEPQYKRYFQCNYFPQPNEVEAGCDDWAQVFSKSSKFLKWFQLDNQVIKVLPIPERDLKAYFRLVRYTEYIMARQGAKIDDWSDLSESDSDSDSYAELENNINLMLDSESKSAVHDTEYSCNATSSGPQSESKHNGNAQTSLSPSKKTEPMDNLNTSTSVVDGVSRMGLGGEIISAHISAVDVAGSTSEAAKRDAKSKFNLSGPPAPHPAHESTVSKMRICRVVLPDWAWDPANLTEMKSQTKPTTSSFPTGASAATLPTRPTIRLEAPDKKNFVKAGLLSRHYKGKKQQSVNQELYRSQIQSQIKRRKVHRGHDGKAKPKFPIPESSVLPPPAYAAAYVRGKQLDFSLRYDIWCFGQSGDTADSEPDSDSEPENCAPPNFDSRED